MISVEINNQQAQLLVDPSRLREAVTNVLDMAGWRDAEISLALVDDQTIHGLNRRHLDHDYPTDVLSFLLDKTESKLEGEIIVSTDTAMRAASEFGWSPQDELLLYVIHGMLHLVGYDDHSDADRAEMRQMEAAALGKLGISLPPSTPRVLNAPPSPGTTSP